MSTLLDGAKRLLGRKSDLGDQVTGLAEAVEAGRGRLDPEVLEPAETVVERITGRLRLSADHTIVAIAGATGSGKSSTFNALTGIDLAATGVRRPTTSWATACIWGSDDADDALEWLGIPHRHRTRRDSLLDHGKRADELSGLVLLDLPDHDSTEVSHHLEMERLIVLADVMIWVLDPQKYADAAIHDRFLAPMAAHKDVMIVVLNHLDEVPEAGREAMLGDVRRLLDQDGLGGVPVLGVSAKHGDGVDELRDLLVKRVGDKQTAKARFRTDLREVAARLDAATGDAPPRELSSGTRRELSDAVAEAAGVPVVVDAVRRATGVRAGRAVGWPPVAWVSRLRPDPLKRLHLDLGGSGRDLVGQARTSLPAATQVQRSRVDSAVRRVADEASAGMTRPWVQAVRGASVSRIDDLTDDVDRAVAQTPLPVETPAWCRAFQTLQWALIMAALAGAAWLGALAVMGFLQVPAPDVPDYAGFPVPTLLLVGGIGAGLLLALLARSLVRLTARSRARSVERRMRSAIEEVTDELVLGPVRAELEAHRAVRAGIDRALH